MRTKVYEQLVKCGLPCFYVSKKNAVADEYIIFSYSNTLSKIADCEESEIKYLLYLNVYTKDDNEDLKLKIIKNMNEIGFYCKNITSVYYEEQLELFNQAMQFQAIKER